MPKFLCKCGDVIRYSDIPSPNEWLVISDVNFDSFEDQIDREKLYDEMKSILRCKNCDRLWIFWDGFKNSPKLYSPEDY